MQVVRSTVGRWSTREPQGRSGTQELAGCRASGALAEVRCNPGQLSKYQRRGYQLQPRGCCGAGNCANQGNLVKGKARKGKRKGKGKGRIEKSKGQGDERRCFNCDGKGHIQSNRFQQVIDEKKSDSNKNTSSTDIVLRVTVVATARENE